jgi:broad specificity phosphatase PhoE
MGSLLLVRHGQASFMAADYDVLSPLGEEQSRRLGARWLARGLSFDAVYVGNRERQKRTCALVAEAYAAAGRPFPAPVELPDLDEMQAQQLLQRSIPDLVAQNPPVRALLDDFHASASTAEMKKRFQLMFERVMEMWVGGELVAPGVETWAEFGARVKRALDGMTAGGSKGRRVAAFTSGGPVAIAVHEALATPDHATIRVAFAVRNASVSEFLFSRDRFSLDVFNEVSHLDEERLLSYR